LKEQAKEKYSDVSDKAKEVKTQAQSKASEWSEKAKDKASEWSEVAKDKVEKAKDKAPEYKEKAADKANELVDSGKEKLETKDKVQDSSFPEKPLHEKVLDTTRNTAGAVFAPFKALYSGVSGGTKDKDEGLMHEQSFGEERRSDFPTSSTTTNEEMPNDYSKSLEHDTQPFTDKITGFAKDVSSRVSDTVSNFFSSKKDDTAEVDKMEDVNLNDDTSKEKEGFVKEE